MLVSLFRLFLDETRLTADARESLDLTSPDGVRVYPYSDICDHVVDLLDSDGKIWVRDGAIHTVVYIHMARPCFATLQCGINAYLCKIVAL